MPHTRDWAVKLLARLKLPAEAEEMLGRPSYWDPTLAAIYFERCDEAIFQQPRAGLKYARVALKLAFLIPEAEDRAGRRAYRELLIQAYWILAGAYRAMGDYPQAQETYSLALKLAAEGEVSPLVRARLKGRLSVLRTCQKRYEEAQKLLDPAIEFFRKSGEASVVDLASALVKLGCCCALDRRFSDAVDSFGEALELIPNPPHKPCEAARTHHAALHNLAGLVTFHSCLPEAVGRARGYARRARRLIRARRSIPKANLSWIEARCLIQLGSTRRGEALLKSVRLSLLNLGAPLEYALASLDLSALWYSEGRWAALTTLAAETYKAFRERGGAADSEALAALSLWVDGVRAQTLSRELIQETSSRIVARLPGGRD